MRDSTTALIPIACQVFIFSNSNAETDKRDEMIEFISKYVKGANYNAIKDLETATQLLEDLKKKYTSKTK